MPIKKVKGGFKFGNSGHTYPTRAGAEKQMKAMFANGYGGKAKGGLVEKEKKKKSSTPTKKPSSKRPKNS